MGGERVEVKEVQKGGCRRKQGSISKVKARTK